MCVSMLHTLQVKPLETWYREWIACDFVKRLRTVVGQLGSPANPNFPASTLSNLLGSPSLGYL